MNIKDRRERVGLTQQQLAEAANCSLSMVRLIDNGYLPMTSPTVDRIESVLSSHEKGRDLKGAA